MAVTRDTLRQVAALRRQVGRDADAAVTALSKAWAAEQRTVDRRWETASAAVATVAVANGAWPRPWELARIPELRDALVATDDSLTDLGRRTDKTVTETATGVVAVVLAAEVLILASQWPAIDRAMVAARFAVNLPARLADLVAATVATRIRAAVEPLASDTYRNLERLVVRGAPVRSPGDTAKALSGLVRAAFASGLTRANTLARTEILDAQRAASHAFRMANLEATTGWVWVSRLDPRSTCAACWVMHGAVFAAAEVGPQGHPGCRCVAVNLHNADNLGALPDARARFDALPEADQVAILGPGRHALYRSGAVAWADLAQRRANRNWRPSYIPRSLTDLQRIARTRQPART